MTRVRIWGVVRLGVLLLLRLLLRLGLALLKTLPQPYFEQTQLELSTTAVKILSYSCV